MLNRLRALVPGRKAPKQPLEVVGLESVPLPDAEPAREEWDRPIEFILSLIGCSVGR